MRREHFLEALFLNEGSDDLGRDEQVLWQGRPTVGGLARSLFHIRAVMGYFAVLAAWNLASMHADGFRANAAFISALWVAVPAIVAAGVIYAMAWLLAATTHYSITNKRVIMRIGVALPIALSLPLRRICSADVKLNADGSGDIPLALGEQKLAYLLIWPHARPWRMKRSQPMMRSVQDAAHVATVLAQALLEVSPSGEAVAVKTARVPERRKQAAGVGVAA
jgi:hypothetical protein